MPDRYFSSQPIETGRAMLRDDEARHLAHVMRAKPGDEILVFDGGGGEWLARVAQVRRSEVDLELIERRDCDRELPTDMTLAVALPKGDRQRWLVEKSVELGVRRLVPLVAERGVAQPVEKALDRLRRAVIEASKQCGRNRLLGIAPPEPWPEFCATATAAEHLRVVADPSGGERMGDLANWMRSAGGAPSLVFAVGPEGGWTEAELQCAAAHGWRIVSLGPRILRIETAALLLASLAHPTA